MWKLGRLLTMFRKELLLAWTVLRDPRAPKLAKLVTVLVALLLFGALMMRVLIDFTLDLHGRIPALLQ